MSYFSLYWLKHYDEIPKVDPSQNLNTQIKDVEWMRDRGIYYAGCQSEGDPGRPANIFGGVHEISTPSECLNIWVSKKGTVYYFDDLKDLDNNSEEDSNNSYNQTNRWVPRYSNVTDYNSIQNQVLPVNNVNNVINTLDTTGNNLDLNRFGFPRHKFRDVTELYKDSDAEWGQDMGDGKVNSGSSGGTSRGPSGGSNERSGGISGGPSGGDCKCDDADNDEENSKEREIKAPVSATKEQATDTSNLRDCDSWRVTNKPSKWPVAKTLVRDPLPDTEKERVIKTVIDELYTGTHQDSSWQEVDFANLIEEYKELGYGVELRMDVDKETDETIEDDTRWGGIGSVDTYNNTVSTKKTQYNYINDYHTKLAEGADDSKRSVTIDVRPTVHPDGTVSIGIVGHFETVPHDQDSGDFDACPSEKNKNENATVKNGGTGATSVGVRPSKAKKDCKCDDKDGGTGSPSGYAGTDDYSGIGGGPSGKNKKEDCEPNLDPTIEDVTPKNKVINKDSVTPKDEVTDSNLVTDTPMVATNKFAPVQYSKIPRARFIYSPDDFDPQAESSGKKVEAKKTNDSCDASKVLDNVKNNAWWIDWFDKEGYNMYIAAKGYGLTTMGALMVLAQAYKETVTTPYKRKSSMKSHNWWGLKGGGSEFKFKDVKEGVNTLLKNMNKKWPYYYQLLKINSVPTPDDVNRGLKIDPYFIENESYCPDCDSSYGIVVISGIKRVNVHFIDFVNFKIKCLESQPSSLTNENGILELKNLKKELKDYWLELQLPTRTYHLITSLDS